MNEHFVFREAIPSDIPRIQVVRHSVNENKLSDPSLVKDEDCKQYLTVRGKGWVCEIDDVIVGFAIADLVDNNIWALFIQPEYENRGIGKRLQSIMLDWYFSKTQNDVWLSTTPGTRAETFYRKTGWKQNGITKNGEIKFEYTFDDWTSLKKISTL